jgi:hypothetical protein
VVHVTVQHSTIVPRALDLKIWSMVNAETPVLWVFILKPIRAMAMRVVILVSVVLALNPMSV